MKKSGNALAHVSRAGEIGAKLGYMYHYTCYILSVGYVRHSVFVRSLVYTRGGLLCIRLSAQRKLFYIHTSCFFGVPAMISLFEDHAREIKVRCCEYVWPLCCAEIQSRTDELPPTVHYVYAVCVCVCCLAFTLSTVSHENMFNTTAHQYITSNLYLCMSVLGRKYGFMQTSLDAGAGHNTRDTRCALVCPHHLPPASIQIGIGQIVQPSCTRDTTYTHAHLHP